MRRLELHQSTTMGLPCVGFYDPEESWIKLPVPGFTHYHVVYPKTWEPSCIR